MRIQGCLCVFSDAFLFVFRWKTPSLKYHLIGFNHRDVISVCWVGSRKFGD